MFDQRTARFGKRRKRKADIAIGSCSARPAKSSKISKYKRQDQHHLNLAQLVMPAKNLPAKGEKAHKQSNRQNVHHLSPTTSAWSCAIPSPNLHNHD
jgi:hypothetical protein